MMDLPMPTVGATLTRHPAAVVATFVHDHAVYRLTLPRADHGGFVFASVHGHRPTLERWEPDRDGGAWDACGTLAWTSPASLQAFAAWCALVDDHDSDRIPDADNVVGIRQRSSSRVKIADIVPIGRAAATLAGIIRTGRLHAITQRGRVTAIIVPIAIWEELQR